MAAPCSLRPKPVLYSSRQSSWLRQVVHSFSKPTTGNVTQPGLQDLALEWKRQGTCWLPQTSSQLLEASLAPPQTCWPIPATMSHMRISLLGIHVLKPSITKSVMEKSLELRGRDSDLLDPHGCHWNFWKLLSSSQFPEQTLHSISF